MTTQDDNPNYKEWIIPPPEGSTPKEIEFYDTLRQLLKIYEPVEKEKDSDVQFTTNELIAAVEQHYAIPQGDPDIPGINGEKLVEYMQQLGYTRLNTGGLQLQWLMKKK